MFRLPSAAPDQGARGVFLTNSRHEPLRFTFLLAPNFSMISPSSAIEPIRVANRLLGRPAFEWRTSSIDGRASIASNGLPLAAERVEDVISRADVMILCGDTRLPEADEGPARDVLEKGLQLGMGGQHIFGRNQGHHLRDMIGPVILKQHEVESRNAAIDEKDQPRIDLSIAQRLIYQIVNLVS